MEINTLTSPQEKMGKEIILIFELLSLSNFSLRYVTVYKISTYICFNP